MCGKIAVLLSLLAQDNNSVLSGTVTDRFATPAANVSVTLSSVERVLQTKSSTNGQFRFQGVPRGTYDLEFANPGFIKQKVSVDFSNGSAQSPTIVLQLSSQPNMDYCGAHPSITYDSPDSRNLKLAGVVRAYENHRPRARAELALWPDDDAQTKTTAFTDAKGAFKIDNLPAGRYHLKVSLKRYLPTEVTPLLVPRENTVFIDIPIVKDDKRLIICQ
jgi:Carboxypeptidase regulatory-like domain